MLSRSFAVPCLAVRSIQTSAPVTMVGPEKAAGRELVGFGATGDNTCQDRLDYWYPAIRFRREGSVISAIRHTEAGDWKKLTDEEKKLFYPELPPTLQDDYKEDQVNIMLVLEKGTFLGPAKHFDYEKNKWK